MHYAVNARYRECTAMCLARRSGNLLLPRSRQAWRIASGAGRWFSKPAMGLRRAVGADNRCRLRDEMATKTLPSVVGGAGGLARYLEEIRKFPTLEPDQEYMLAKRWQEHADSDAAHTLVTSHLRLVTRIAMGYRGYGLPIGEVISEGNVGLMQAVKKFEPERGFRLATYAMWWIKASIQEYILRSWSLVKMGTTANQKRLFFNLRKVKGKIQALDDGDLKPDQIAEMATRLNGSEAE